MGSATEISRGVGGPARELRIPRAIGDLKQAIEELGQSFEVLEKRLMAVTGPDTTLKEAAPIDRLEGHRANGANTGMQAEIDSARADVTSLQRRVQAILDRLEL